jgi:hypothetical protein
MTAAVMEEEALVYGTNVSNKRTAAVKEVK